VYVGTGDSVGGSSGDGMYKSIDAGKTWTHIGLEETVKINKLTVDPKDPNIVVASTQGDAQHNGRGIYRTTDGGKTWENTLRPENANGTRDLEYAFDMPNLMFATSQGSGGGFGGGGGVRTPGSILAFSTINGTFNTVLGPISQNGIDMPPTKAEVDTWESGCREFTTTLNAWTMMLSADFVNFNSLLAKNSLAPLKITPTAVTAPVSCKFVWSAVTPGGRK
jgi:hypothetical protein